MVDAPGGGGKVPLLPEYVEEINDDEVIFRNFQGQRFTYKQPKRYEGERDSGHRADRDRGEEAANGGEEGEPAAKEKSLGGVSPRGTARPRS
ncbi:MAG TPA: hypothetical protein VM166_03910 [Gemmatimonadaceae bacterium]|nr:hypothetical protein [Gemmatimonadaceae bacterium]